MSIRPRFLVSGLVLALLSPALVSAASQGRVFGVVTDEAEQPVAGLTITAFVAELPTIKTETETDEKGEYSVTLPDATHTYTYRLTKEGYESFETSFKVPAGATRAMNFTVVKGSLLAPDAFNEGNVAARAGDYALAEEKYRHAIELDSELVPAHAALATVLLLRKGYAEAADAAEAGLALEPGDHRLLTVRYEAFRLLGDEDKAAEALAALQAADPERAAADLFERAGRLFEAGQIGEAKELLEKAVEADPEHAKAHYLLGLCLVNTGDSVAARDHLTRFVEMAPDDPDVATATDMLKYLQ